MQKVRFSVFADLHVHDHRTPDSIGRLKITPRVLSEKLILPMKL